MVLWLQSAVPFPCFIWSLYLPGNDILIWRFNDFVLLTVTISSKSLFGFFPCYVSWLCSSAFTIGKIRKKKQSFLVSNLYTFSIRNISHINYYRTMDIRTNWRTVGDCLELKAVDGVLCHFFPERIGDFHL